MKRFHPLYSIDSIVYAETPAPGEEKLDVMRRAIARSGFLEDVEKARRATGKVAADFSIAIKPNLMTASIREPESPVYTDPHLVEELISQLRGRGFTRIALVESHNVYDYSYRDRTVQAVAEMAGYSGEGYTIEDLSEQMEPWDYGGVLGRHFVGRAWRDADYRISFAKNKTHWQCFYTGCMKNVYGCLPEWNKVLHYHGRGREFFESCILMLDNFDVHFGFLDAWTSGDGFSGHVHDAHPNQTRTVLASKNVFALDWVMGEKMGLDPSLNYVIQEALYYWGTFDITRVGNMTPWHPWSNVRAVAVIVLSAVEESHTLTRFFSRALAARQDRRFRPVSSWQWLYGPLQWIAGRLMAKAAPTPPGLRQ